MNLRHGRGVPKCLEPVERFWVELESTRLGARWGIMTMSHGSGGANDYGLWMPPDRWTKATSNDPATSEPVPTLGVVMNRENARPNAAANPHTAP